jgi:glycosyltransferase involved in cell wall biosynthesis
MKVAHLTSVHIRSDTRILLKQCRSLADHGYEVTLIVADGKGDEVRQGVRIVDAGASTGRLDRFSRAAYRVLRKAIAVDASLYHLHDPELLPAGLILKSRGKHVIFDSHEDVPEDILMKSYIPRTIRPSVALATGALQSVVSRRLDGVIAATPFIEAKFTGMGIRTVNINNYPMLDELNANAAWETKKREICHVGTIAAIRGILELVRACELFTSGARLNLVGRLAGTDIEAAVRREKGWERVNELGYLDRRGVREVFARSVAGVVTMHPYSAHLDALPNKLFEYLSAGLPVIASNFPLWREIVKGNECGLVVDPFDIAAIAVAVDRLVNDPDLSRRMGENGRKIIQTRYNWSLEEKKLLDFYEMILR